ncbi:unnamed protein product, partial [Closterium sp. Naga37s-1]
PRFFPRGVWSARRSLNHAVVSAASASSSAQQPAVPTGTGEGSRLGGQWQMGGGHVSQIMEEDGRKWTKEEVYEDFLKLRDGVNASLAARSQTNHSHSHTSHAYGNIVTDASSLSNPQLEQVYRSLNEVTEEELLAFKAYLDLLIAIFSLTEFVELDDSPQVCTQKAVQEYHRRRAQGVLADLATFHALLALSCHVDHKTTLELYALMRKEGLQPNDDTFQLLFKSACIAGDMSSLKPIVREVDGSLDEESYSSSSIDLYHILINRGRNGSQEDIELAWRFYQGMESDKIARPNAETFNILIKVNLQAGDHEGALRAYKLMSASGFARDLSPEFWNKLIHAVAAVPSAPAYVAYGCYDGMQRWGPEPDEATYLGLMAVCARDGDAARAMALRREMEDGGLEVTAAVFHALISVQGKAGAWEAAVETFREMQTAAKGELEHPLHPSQATYTRLFDACFGPEGADAAIQGVVQEGQTLTFTPALQAAVSIFREAATDGAFPPALTADPFTLYVVDCTRSVAAVALLSLLLRLASSSITGHDASSLQNLVVATATLQAQTQATGKAPPQEEPTTELQGTMEAMLQALGLKGERLHATSALQGLCVDREDLRLWLETQAALVFLA